MLTYLVSMFPSALEAQSGQGKSFEDRLKEAAKPWEYGLICYVQVDPSKEATYLEFVKNLPPLSNVWDTCHTMIAKRM